MAFPTHIVAAGGYVFDEAGNILLVKTRSRGWDCPGGQVEAGETLEEGLLREIFEESGITARVERLAGVYSNVSTYLWKDTDYVVPTKVMFDFICTYVSGSCTPSEETSEVMWVPREKALDYVTAPAMRYRYAKALTFDGHVVYASYKTHPEFQIKNVRYI